MGRIPKTFGNSGAKVARPAERENSYVLLKILFMVVFCVFIQQSQTGSSVDIVAPSGF